MGPKLAIPTGYDGYFEILSEDGRAVKCIESVPELARRFPDSVLVRQDFKALVSKSDDLHAITGHHHQGAPGSTSSTCTTSSGESGNNSPAAVTQSTVRTVQNGETLILVGEVKSGKSYLR